MHELVGPEWIQDSRKRQMDVCLALGSLPVATPLLAGSTAAIALFDRVNPVFMQERIGEGNQTFFIPKLRTLPGVSEPTPAHRGHDDPRASRIGSVLRRTHLDELPQVLSVLRGDMSAVGPRPIIKGDYDATMESLSVQEQREWQYARDICKPGGAMPYNSQQHTATAGTYSLRDRALQDIEYSRTATFRGDLDILSRNILLGITQVVGLDVREREGFPQTIGALSEVAKQFGVEIVDNDIRYWTSVGKVSRFVDNYVDKHDGNDLEVIWDDLLNGVATNGFSSENASEFREVFAGLDLAKQEAIKEGLQISDFANRSRNAQSADELMETRLQEAALFTKIIELPISQGSADAEYREKFNDWLYSFMRAGYAIDSLIDVRVDHEVAGALLEPTMKVRAGIAKRALIESGATFRDLPKGAIPSMTSSGINMIIRYHLRNK